MKRFFWILMLCSYCSSSQSDYVRVTINQLLINPERYHNKKIVVKGFLHVKFEDRTLYDSKEKANYLTDEALWINFDSTFKANNDINSYDTSFVELSGIFNQNNHGHMGSTMGAIEQVREIRKLRKWYNQ